MENHALDALGFPRIRELVAAHAMSSLGRSIAAALRPATKTQIVRRWMNQVNEMRRAEQGFGLPPFGDITDVRELVKRSAPPLQLSVDDVARIGRTLAGTHAVSAYMAALPEDMPELRSLRNRVGDFSTIADRIGRVIDDRGRVRDDASGKLERIRRQIEEATEAIRQVMNRLVHDPNILRVLQYPNFTFSNDRMVLPVKTEARTRIPGVIHRSSDSGATVYVEPGEVLELNNEISRLRADEAEEIERLLWELVHEVHINHEAIIKTLDTLAVLDLIVAKLRFAKAFGMICPALSDDPRVRLRSARHPLLIDIARQRAEAGEPPMEVVPIDVRLGEEFDMLIITGPNTGGKTVTLKTVGLICLMVQSGLPVPVAEGSEVGLFQAVMIDIGDEQSLQQSLSTFSAHMRRVLDMLHRSNDRTLILIDELGAGTDPDEGAALGRAILDELLHRRSRCIVTTHLGALKAYALTRQRVENASVEFDLQSLRPTYHLRIGEAGNSNAIAIADRLGMPRRMIEAAKRNLSRRGRALQAAIAGSAESKRRAEAARAAAENARVAAAGAHADAQAAEARLRKQQEDFQQWVRHVVHLRSGDPVRVRNFDRDGRIVRMNLEQQRAEVDIGDFAVEVPMGDLLPPHAPPPPPPPERRPARAAAAGNGQPPVMQGRPRRLPQQGGREADGRRQPAGPREREPGRPREGGQRRQEEPPKPVLPSLTDAQAGELKAGDTVVAKRFHRQGRVIRVIPARKVAVVSVGLLEVEVPFNGLALPDSGPRPDVRKASPPKAPRPAGSSHANAAAAANTEDVQPTGTNSVAQAADARSSADGVARVQDGGRSGAPESEQPPSESCVAVEAAPAAPDSSNGPT